MKLTRLLAFAAIGTAVGLLLTTEKGKKFRNEVSDKSGDLLKRLNKLSKNTVADLEDVAASGKKAAKEYV